MNSNVISIKLAFPQKNFTRFSQKEEVVMNRLPLGNTYGTYMLALNNHQFAP